MFNVYINDELDKNYTVQFDFIVLLAYYILSTLALGLMSHIRLFSRNE